jgi:hypothetical protein
MQCHATQASRGRLSLFPPLFWTPNLMRGCIIWLIVLPRAIRSASTSTSIGDCDGGGTRWSYLVPPCPAQGAAPLIFCVVVSAVAPLALPRSRKGGRQSQQNRHSAKNQKWGIQERFGSVHGGKFEERRQYQFCLVEFTCGALGTDQNSTPYIIRRESQRETQLSVPSVQVLFNCTCTDNP